MIVAKLRTYGNLPDKEKLSDDILQPHLDSAKRTIARALPDADNSDPDYIESVLCQAMIFCLPSANLMTSEGISDCSETGINRRWLTPTEITAKIEYYEKRKAELLSALKPDTEKPSNFYYEEL